MMKMLTMIYLALFMYIYKYGNEYLQQPGHSPLQFISDATVPQVVRILWLISVRLKVFIEVGLISKLQFFYHFILLL